jgi:hypothetical protein
VGTLPQANLSAAGDYQGVGVVDPLSAGR